MGIIIYYVDKISKQEKEITDMSLKDAILIGCSQVFALIPGFSRSGTTITAARILKLDRESAAKFSFFLSAPVVCGAVFLQLIKSGTIDLIISNFIDIPTWRDYVFHYRNDLYSIFVKIFEKT